MFTHLHINISMHMFTEFFTDMSEFSKNLEVVKNGPIFAVDSWLQEICSSIEKDLYIELLNYISE